MKNHILLFSTLLLLLFSSCGSDDDLMPAENCGDQLICWSSTLATGDSVLQVLRFDNPVPDSVNPVNIGNLVNFNPQRIIIPTCNTVYDKASKQLVGIVSREKKLIMHQANSGLSTSFDLPTTITAPLFLNGNCYGIEVQRNSPTINFRIRQIDLSNGQLMDSLVLNSNSFNTNSFFFHESMSAATDGNDELYFLSGTNLLRIKVTSGEVIVYDFHPGSNSSNDFISFYGLEFKSTNKLLAIREGSNDFDLVEISLNGNSAQLSSRFDIAANFAPMGRWTINSEFYTTVYDACKDIYHLSTLTDLNPTATSKLVTIDLNDNSVRQQMVNDYWFGINLME